jgi:hypothetical protein
MAGNMEVVALAATQTWSQQCMCRMQANMLHKLFSSTGIWQACLLSSILCSLPLWPSGLIAVAASLVYAPAMYVLASALTALACLAGGGPQIFAFQKRQVTHSCLNHLR